MAFASFVAEQPLGVTEAGKARRKRLLAQNTENSGFAG
jgi:hypothetical protein